MNNCVASQQTQTDLFEQLRRKFALCLTVKCAYDRMAVLHEEFSGVCTQYIFRFALLSES